MILTFVFNSCEERPMTSIRLSLPFVLTLAACGSSSPPIRDVAAQYGALVVANYDEAVTRATALRDAVDAFVAAPSQQTLDAARAAWIAARPSYSMSEAFRFYGGPIDDEDTGPEGRINAWPLDESYVDYVDGNPTAGIINDAARFPTLDAATIAEQNEKDGEKNISTGYHAIEFLLWGQDKNADGPGARPYTDYLTGAGATAENQARRGAYLRAVAQLLVDDLTTVRDAWRDEPGTYRRTLVDGTPPREVVRRMLLGIQSLSGIELGGERMEVALVERDQENEQDCFSDNTLADLEANQRGIENVYFGRYGTLSGASLDALVAARDPSLASRTRAAIADTLAAIRAIPGPFDQAVLGDDDAPSRQKISAALEALRTQTTLLDQVGDLLLDPL
jgi:putative iron-regulated protein